MNYDASSIQVQTQNVTWKKKMWPTDRILPFQMKITTVLCRSKNGLRSWKLRIQSSGWSSGVLAWAAFTLWGISREWDLSLHLKVFVTLVRFPYWMLLLKGICFYNLVKGNWTLLLLFVVVKSLSVPAGWGLSQASLLLIALAAGLQSPPRLSVNFASTSQAPTTSEKHKLGLQSSRFPKAKLSWLHPLDTYIFAFIGLEDPKFFKIRQKFHFEWS